MRTTEAQNAGILFLALDTYGRPGGIQRFNQRVIAALAEIAGEKGWKRPVIHIMRDGEADIPQTASAAIRAFGRRRLDFIVRSAVAALNCKILFLGHINLLPVGLICKLVAPRIKLVLFVHGDEVWNDPAYRRMRFYEPLMARALSRIASVSTFTASRMQKAFKVPAETFRLFPNAVDDIDRQPQSSGRNILTVARLDRHDRGKNIEALIKAMALLKRRNVECVLRIVGEGSLRSELASLAHELAVEERVEFLGRVSDARLAEAYAQARLFAMPSSKEGFGIVFLEAWLHGLPVICGTQDAAAEIITDGVDGLAVDPGDIEILAARVAMLLAHPDLAAAMGRAGAEKVRSRYLMRNFKGNLEKIIAELP
ncbi:glycosyltransferase family 4 protein [Neorhizobium galegae]|uniref:glycosyltransferase family 4 protein n=1 Tax=Neorhizobium galegae TaxID=399 RepID=UPI000621A3D7|nr:glycosyltransferase family 4 protein [Neorhizobium galegae]MCQ1767714.1 glycosyltransferase family 4 protein [Neorhizobium galegae]MCQ1848053.1 glycosyltransferase family 4 protein [Neorhizobium galegae]CDZ42882.1 Glycosyltransferase, family 1 [Neorhizobium galegae bv. officinalis]